MKIEPFVPQSNHLLLKGFHRLIGFSSCLGLIAGPVAAQEGDHDVFELSPFEVEASSDTGSYEVQETLAGSRLRSDMKNVGAAITNLSTGFLDDVGASDLMDVVDFLPSTEAESTTIDTQDNSGPFRAQRFRVRGLFTESIARNYNAGIVGEYMPPSDGYNTDLVTLSAGANSILFGSANPAGVINTQTITASFDGDSYRLRNRIDSYGTNRIEFSTNQELIDDKLAVRIAFLEEEREYFRDPQWLDQSRIYGALKWKLTDKTTLSGNLEYMDYARNSPVPSVQVDRFGAWNDAGKPTVAINGTADATGGVEGVSNRNGEGTNFVNPIFGSAGSIDVIQSWKNYAVGSTYPGDAAIDLNLMDHEQNFTENLRIDDRHAWIGDISIEHKFTDNLHMQLSYFAFEHRKDIFAAWGTHNLWADASSTLADGTPNPNMGRYYLDPGPLQLRDFKYDASNLRWTTSYDLDLRDRTEWLGRHQLAFMVEGNKGHRYTDRAQLFNVDPNTADTSSPRGGVNKIQPIFYVDLDGGVRDSGQPLDARYIDTYLSTFEGVDAQWRNFTEGTNVETQQGVYLGAVQSHLFDDRLVTTVGYRVDTQDVYDVSGGAWDLDASGYYRDYSDSQVSRTLNEAVSGVNESTYSYGGVYHLMRNKDWIDHFSLSYNRSNNFSPSASDFNFQGDPRSFSTGQTIDYGFKAGLFEGKLNATLTWFESAQNNARQSGASTDRVLVPINTIWEGLVDALGDSSLESNIIGGNAANGDTFDVETKGIEGSLTYRPTDSWRIAAFLSKNEAVNSNINPSARLYLDENLASIQQNYGNVSVVTTDGTQTVNEVLDKMLVEFDKVLATEGQQSNEMRKWKLSVLTSYNFNEGLLDGFSLGGYVKWQDEAVIGYAYDNGGVLNTEAPFWGDDILNAGLNFGYSRDLRNDKVKWTIQLNIRNLFDDSDPLAIRAEEDPNNNDVALPYSYRIVEPRSFVLTNTFSF